VRLDVADEDAYEVLERDRGWNAYTIADLEPPYAQYARVALAARPDGTPEAACLLLAHPAFSCLIPHGPPEGVEAILHAAGVRGRLPERPFIHARPQHLDAVARRYSFPRPLQPMWRMAVDAATFRAHRKPMPGVVMLGPEDIPALEALYSGYEANAFNADQLLGGVFYGVRDGGELLCAAGTHALSARHAVAAVGNVYTRPEARGRGLGSAVTSAVVSELLAGACQDVVLNVAEENEGARRIYARLGFREHCRYKEGAAQYTAASPVRSDE
jgi:ribosomal protein S18 acetylase RimI-like enzyme